MTQKTLSLDEAKEMLAELDRLGLALASKTPPHHWSKDERRWYEEATGVMRAVAEGDITLDSPAHVESAVLTYRKAVAAMRSHLPADDAGRTSGVIVEGETDVKPVELP